MPDARIPTKLDALVESIEQQLQRDPELSFKSKTAIHDLLDGFQVDMQELRRFVRVDVARNLISTYNETYSLLLLCWNRGQYSPIHDHKDTGCWVKHIQGHVHEVRYEQSDGRMVETSNVVHTSGVSYMEDALGFHKLGNPRDDLDAITMHLYSPPYRKCHLWLDPRRCPASAPSTESALSTLIALPPPAVIARELYMYAR